MFSGHTVECWGPWSLRPRNSHLCSVSAITETIETPQFIGRSYLTYDNPDILKR